jgi:hypothetical protein
MEGGATSMTTPVAELARKCAEELGFPMPCSCDDCRLADTPLFIITRHITAATKDLAEENARLRVLIAKELPEYRQRIISLESTFRHTHISNGQNDCCNECGFDLRDSIHNRLEKDTK